MAKGKLKQAEEQIEEQNEDENQQDEEEKVCTDILQLENINGINHGDLLKLKENGFPTIESMNVTSYKLLESIIKNYPQVKYDKIKEAIKKKTGLSSSFRTGNQVMDNRKTVKRITTGSQLLDNILGGGIETQNITEVYGEFRTGKTQLAHTLCVTGQLSKKDGGGQGKVLYIDTEGTFRPERIPYIAQRFGLDPDETMDNIIHARAYNVEHQFELIKEANNLIFETGPFSVLIVDSIMACFRTDFSGRGELADRQQQLGQFMKRLNEIATINNMAVFITNQVQADPSGQKGPQMLPIGGCVLGHASTVRIGLRKGKDDQRIATIVDHPNMKEDSIKFMIREDGIYDHPNQ